MSSKLTLVLLVAVLGTACSQSPAAIVLENAPSKIETLDAVPVPKAIVKDEDGNALDPQPELVFETKPTKLLELTGTTMMPLASGDAVLVVKLREGELVKEHKIKIQLVDRIQLTCEPESCKYGPGDKFRLRATALSGAAKIEKIEYLWASDDMKVVQPLANGEMEALAPGTTRVTATARGINAAMTINVVSPVEQLVVVCPSPAHSLMSPSASKGEKKSCVVGTGNTITLTAEVRGGGKLMDNRVSWKSTNPAYVIVSGGTIQGVQDGAAIIEASVGSLRVQLPVEVRRDSKAQCTGPLTDSFLYPLPDAPASFLCGMPDGVKCMEKATMRGKKAKKLSGVALLAAGKKCCCAQIPVMPPAPEQKPETAKPDGAAAPDGEKKEAPPEGEKKEAPPEGEKKEAPPEGEKKDG